MRDERGRRKVTRAPSINWQRSSSDRAALHAPVSFTLSLRLPFLEAAAPLSTRSRHTLLNTSPRLLALAPLQHPVFRSVWLASMVSNLGALIQSVGASWMMISLGQPADMVALVQASVTLPTMLLSLLSGAVADSLDRRKIMLAAQSFMLIASVALSICAWTGLLTPVLLLSFTFLIGCGSAFNGPAWQASVGDMVPRADLPGAVALNGMGFNLARSVGPAIGGAIVAVAGAAAAFTVNAASYIALITVLTCLVTPASLMGALAASRSSIEGTAVSPVPFTSV